MNYSPQPGWKYAEFLCMTTLIQNEDHSDWKFCTRRKRSRAIQLEAHSTCKGEKKKEGEDWAVERGHEEIEGEGGQGGLTGHHGSPPTDRNH